MQSSYTASATVVATRADENLPPGVAAPAAIVALLHKHVHDADVALHGCRELYKISCVQNGAQAAVDASAPAAIVAIMRAHVGHADVMQFGCRVLLNIQNIAVGMQAAIGAGAPAAIVAAMRAHNDNSDVVHIASVALAGMALSESGQQSVVDAGALETVVAALHTHPGAAIVARDGCFSLAILTLYPSGRQAAIDAGACVAIASALNAHAGDINIAREGCNALERIPLNDRGALAAFDAGALAGVAAVMTAHASILSARDVLRRMFRWACETNCVDAMRPCVENSTWARRLVLADGVNALCWSARNGHLAGVILLHENGADIRARDDYAAHWASRNGHQPVVDYLLVHGAELTVGELVLDGLPPDELAARLKSCSECWAARPQRLVCPRSPGAQPPHNAPHECGICMRFPDCCEPSFPGGAHYEGSDCDACRPFWEKEWVAFRCGHVCHLRCAMRWAASKTHNARADDSLEDAPRVDCPHGRCVEIVHTRRAPPGQPLPDGLVRVTSIAPSASGGSGGALSSSGAGAAPTAARVADAAAHSLSLCGGSSASTVLSHLGAEHSHGHGLLGFFSMKDARALRLVCKEFRDAVAGYPWADSFSHIRGPLAHWRKSFPLALAANVACRRDLTAADVFHLRGCHTLDISHCAQLTDDAFAHFSRVRVLDMGGCGQAGITDAAFAHIPDVEVLNVGGCEQLTGAALAHLRCVRELSVALCRLNAQSFKRLPNPHLVEALDVTGLGSLDAKVLDFFPAIKAVNATFSSLLRQVQERGIPHIAAQILPSLPDPTAYHNRGRVAYAGGQASS
jgi:hypothetical protein